jgi:mRNA interferase MazF
MQDHNSWNEVKKHIDSKNNEIRKFPKSGEVWTISFGKNIGYEQNGTSRGFTRPGLIVKKFNNQLFWAVPLTTKQKDFDFYFNFTDPNGVPVSAILAQLRVISSKRLEDKLYKMEINIYRKISQILRSFL